MKISILTYLAVQPPVAHIRWHPAVWLMMSSGAPEWRVAQSQHASLAYSLNTNMETAEGGNLSKVDGQYVYQERSLEEHQKHVRRLKALLSAISGSARIVPGRDVIALENQASGRSLIRPSAGTAPKQSSLLVALVAYFGLTTTD